MQPVHDVAPDGRGARDAGHVVHRRAGEIADPHAHRVARRVPHAPVVAHVLGRAGLRRAPDAGRERILEPERRRARAAVREYVGDDEARGWAEHAARRHVTRAGARVRARLGKHARRSGDAAVRKRAVRVGEREQRDVGAAQRQRRAVVVGGFRQRVEPEVAQRLVEALAADELERAHGRHVERTRERRAHTDAAAEVAVVVLRHVHAARGGDRERAVVDERGGGQQLRVERERVQEGLERRACLPQRDDAVDFPGARQQAAAADVREHVARRVVEHDERAVAHAARGELRQVVAQRSRSRTPAARRRAWSRCARPAACRPSRRDGVPDSRAAPCDSRRPARRTRARGSVRTRLPGRRRPQPRTRAARPARASPPARAAARRAPRPPARRGRRVPCRRARARRRAGPSARRGTTTG